MKKILLMAIIAIFAVTTASAQDKGDWGIGPKIGIYTNTGGGAIFGIGAAARYNILDQLRIEPAITALCKTGCSVDINCDFQYLFNVADKWTVYPLAGLSANDIGGWSCGINLGAGCDYRVADHWDISAGLKWMIQTAVFHRNPIVINVGGTYRF